MMKTQASARIKLPKIDRDKAHWTAEILEYATFCGPAVLAATTGISREEAADKLMEAEEQKDFWKRGKTDIQTIGLVLNLPVESTAIRTNGMGRSTHVRFTDKYPTLVQWLEANPMKVAILRASHHFVFVGFGRVIESNGWEPKRGRVTHAIILSDFGA